MSKASIFISYQQKKAKTRKKKLHLSAKLNKGLFRRAFWAREYFCETTTGSNFLPSEYE